MKKILPIICSLTLFSGVSFGQIQISGGGTNNIVFTVMRDIVFKIDSGEAWGYRWGVRVNNSLSSCDNKDAQASLLNGSGSMGAVSLGGTAPVAYVTYPVYDYAPVSPFILDNRLGTSYAAPGSFANNGAYLYFEFDYDFKMSVGSTFTLAQGSYSRPWLNLYGPTDPNILLSPGTTYTITKDDFFSYTMEGSPLNTSNISLVVPEPSALSLLAVGLGGFALIRRRRS